MSRIETISHDALRLRRPILMSGRFSNWVATQTEALNTECTIERSRAERRGPDRAPRWADRYGDRHPAPCTTLPLIPSCYDICELYPNRFLA